MVLLDDRADLRYFGWDEEAQMVCGVYAWYNQASMDEYKAGELFASHEKMPHFSWADSTVEAFIS